MLSRDLIGKTRHHDHLHLRAQGQKTPHQFTAVHPRHHQVCHQHVNHGRIAFRYQQSFVSIPRFEGDIAQREAEGGGLDGSLSADEAQRIRAVLDRRGFRGSDIVLAVSSEKLLTANLELPLRTPSLDSDTVGQIARQEFARALKQEANSFEFAFWDLPLPARAAKATHVLAAGCPIAQSEPLLAAFDAAGLSICAMDVESCALARACAPALAPPEQITAILEIGSESARLSIVHQGMIAYCRRLDALG